LRRRWIAAIGFILALIFYWNCKLYYNPSWKHEDQSVVNQDVAAQLAHLKSALDNGTADQLQKEYPEGYVFFISLYALALCEQMQSHTVSAPEYKDYLTDLHTCLDLLQSDSGRAPFQKELKPAYGIFYAGWSNYVLAQSLLVAPDERKIQTYQYNCAEIAAAFDASASPYLQSYGGQAWPADNIVALASLKHSKQIGGIDYTSLLQNQIEKIKNCLDLDSRLIPHSASWLIGQTIQSPRGSSQSLMLCFLPEIDSAFAQNQYELFEKQFIDTHFGLEAVREYPIGIHNWGDIDSGPVIWGIGTAATITGIRAALKNKAQDRYISMRNCIEALGFPFQTQGKKQFLFGQQPMADAFLAWVNSAERKPLESSRNWRWEFQIWSLVVGAILVWTWRRFRLG
jgi:hypothetical protein